MQPPYSGLDFANSDIAFARDYLFMGDNFNGFTAYSIEDTAKAHAVAAVVCPGGQGDVSVYGNLLFMSVEQTRGRIDCGTQGVNPPVSAERFRGVRIFDISNSATQSRLRRFRPAAALTPTRWSPIQRQQSSTSMRQAPAGSVPEKNWRVHRCRKDDPNTALFSIDVIQVPLAAPQNAKSSIVLAFLPIRRQAL